MEKGPLSPHSLGPRRTPKRPAVVVVHGLTGAPWDMLPIAQRLATAGFAVEVPLLTGHDAGPEGVGAASRADWRDDVRRAAETAAGRSKAGVILMGLSMGGLLSLELTIEGLAPVRGVAAFASPLSLGRLAQAAGDLAAKSTLIGGLHWPKIGGPDIQNKAALPGPEAIPLSAVGELNALIDTVRSGLHDVHVPLLVIQSRHDHTAPPWSAWEIFKLAGASWKRLVILKRGFHVITRDVTSAQVAEEALAFAERVSRNKA